MKKIVALLFITSFVACTPSTQKNQKNNIYKAQIKELSDAQYPDDPDIPLRSEKYGQFHFNDVEIAQEDSLNFSFTLLPNKGSDTIVFSKFDLRDFIPTIPAYLNNHKYLSFISLVNLEWNRQQVRYMKTDSAYQVKGGSADDFDRIDIARNCLNSGLWEVIAYREEYGDLKPVYHGWFDFPIDLYEQLFDEQNTISFSTYSDYLINWKDPESKSIDLTAIRTIKQELSIVFESLNDRMYIKNGERKKKFKNIIFPKNPQTINDFLTDSTRFATFTPPGFYNTKDPRKTQLGRFKHLKHVMYRGVKGVHNAMIEELELEFLRDNGEVTRLIVGGVDLNAVPTLSDSLAHKGTQMPMGLGNHSFYEHYKYAHNHDSKESLYYAFLLDEKGNWLDSHTLGIDGPLFYYNEQGLLNMQLLSFERHAVVGWFTLEL